ncbi:hypothetical protein KTT_54530 [Tengunoibacter tsumagoiensis]|uniref:Uncharacterized protein n=1 Tax=Tengunoibacter tsumagoiensis TaxID=2014871 RepID=A0A402A8T7_9CHLR|nr:hypothetical protein KTT_54530 [Tengunoibacter tsumagoiensis]
MFLRRNNSTEDNSLAGIDSSRSAMPDVWFGEQSQAERAICGNHAISPAKVTTSAQRYTLDRAGN